MSARVYISNANRNGLRAMMPVIPRMRFEAESVNRPFRCPNPERNDCTPSATYYADKHQVHCFGCEQTWDVLQLMGVAEGLLDAMALEKKFDKPTMALGGVPYANWLANVSCHTPADVRLGKVIICMDEDDEGRRAAKKVVGDLDSIGAPHATLPPYPNGAKDTDEWLMARRGTEWDCEETSLPSGLTPLRRMRWMNDDAGKMEANLSIANLHGKVSSIDALADGLLDSFKPDEHGLVIADPANRVRSGRENDANAIAASCGELDRLVEGLRCAIAYSHHHSKGTQVGKNADDRASDSGVFARDADALIDMTELEWDESARETKELLHWREATPFRLEFVLRDFKVPKPKDIWFRYPVHVEDLSGMLEDGNSRKPGGNGCRFGEQGGKALSEIEIKLVAFMGEYNEIKRKVFVAHIGNGARTVSKYVGRSRPFELESGESSTTIRRVKAAG